ncbi:hypothetical protein EVAR_985_1 [Eumeta japonica]|uniref:Uncharacterized protein n=1 Tax=Eumeta variegata TaxID=151549 RepID=A0A4C1SEA8_EUMVA|nr:hypothetical protein EVAR_985_1 [Eumeta japonica]
MVGIEPGGGAVLRRTWLRHVNGQDQTFQWPIPPPSPDSLIHHLPSISIRYFNSYPSRLELVTAPRLQVSMGGRYDLLYRGSHIHLSLDLLSRKTVLIIQENSSFPKRIRVGHPSCSGECTRTFILSAGGKKAKQQRHIVLYCP